MLESFGNPQEFKYQRLTNEEQQSRGILGRLKGVIANTLGETRNGRLYGKKLWEGVFEDPLMKEKIANRCVFGELGHPEGRVETDMEKIAICLAEQPKLAKDGKLYGVFDILNTPNGKILKALCDYGCKIGVSSRGSGDTFTNDDGQEEVDGSSYQCECWDAVLMPAVTEARMELVTESLNKRGRKKKELSAYLTEAVNKAKVEDRKIMNETISKLGLLKECNNASCSDKKEVKVGSIKKEVGNAKSEIVENLQKALCKNRELERKLVGVQERLSVSNALVEKLNIEVANYKDATARLSSKAKLTKDLQLKNSQLQEQISKKNTEISQLNEKLKKSSNSKVLNESLGRKNDEINSLKEQLDFVKNSYSKKLREVKEDKTKQSHTLNEEIDTLKKNNEQLQNKVNEFKERLLKAKELVEKYDKQSKLAVDKYIKTKADISGISKNDIVSRLGESYTFKDIDNICEELQSANVRMRRLPYAVNNGNNIKMKFVESKNEIVNTGNDDDIVDESLLSLLGRIK